MGLQRAKPEPPKASDRVGMVPSEMSWPQFYFMLRILGCLELLPQARARAVFVATADESQLLSSPSFGMALARVAVAMFSVSPFAEQYPSLAEKVAALCARHLFPPGSRRSERDLLKFLEDR